MRGVVDLAGKVARSPGTAVLIHGETGTGKELLARYIHRLSAEHQDRAFLRVVCAARCEGLPLLTPGATLCLREPGDLDATLQAELLGARELGSETRRTPEASVRVVSLTQGLFDQSLRQGTLRPDLYHRLCVFRIEVPPLRTRPEDILPLARAFLTETAARLGKKITGIARAAEGSLLRYAYPGNVRELRNIVERAVILEAGTELTIDAPVPRAEPQQSGDGAAFFQVHCAPGNPPPGLRDVERAYVLRVLELSGGNKSQAARLLGVSFPTLAKKLAEVARSS